MDFMKRQASTLARVTPDALEHKAQFMFDAKCFVWREFPIV